MAETLRGSQRTYLRGLAHHLRPTVQIGKEGLTEGVLESARAALDASELVKVQFVASRDEKRAIVAVLEEELGSTCVGTIGHIAVLFRRHPDPEKRRIKLPG